MILPNKYIRYCDSYIFMSDQVLGIVHQSRSQAVPIEKLWSKFSCSFPEVTYQRFYKSLILLIMLRLVSVNREGEIYETQMS